MRACIVFTLAALICASPVLSQRAPGLGPGPWDNDVLVFRATGNGRGEPLATFPRAGVPALARLKDGQMIAAHQHFPESNDADFDKVAVLRYGRSRFFSSDCGLTWRECL